MTEPNVFLKDPLEAKFDLYIDWTTWLADAGDATLVEALVSVPDGLTLVSSTTVGSRVHFRLAGGTIGQIYRVICQVLTDRDHDPVESVYIKIVEK